MELSRKLVVPAVLALVASFATAGAAAAAPTDNVQRLIDDCGGDARVSVDPVSGAARFVRLEPGSAAHAMAPSGAAADRALDFFRVYGGAFGCSDADAELQATRTIRDAHGNEHATFQQMHKGVPVFGGELRAHFNSQGDLFAVNGNFVAIDKLDTNPTLTPEAAAARAIRAVALEQFKRAKTEAELGGDVSAPDESIEKLSAAATALTVFQAGLLRGTPGPVYLAYEVEVVDDGGSVREFVYVDAHRGRVIDQITGIHDGLFRRAYDGMNLPTVPPGYPGSPFWVEGDPFPTGTVEADNMIIASKETYDLFWNAFGRDSFDGSGAMMDSIFNRGYGCPNASWNGIFISFCPGYTTDDVTAHEWGHAYTDYTNDLIYQWQSGALNESYSDIWGETVDLINGRMTDAPGGLRTDGSCSDFGAGGPGDNSYRWLLGEDVGLTPPPALGAIRDMWNPNCYNDPASVTDPLYWCTSGDSGGVHINSGIPNRAFSLMVDGGTFNGYTIAGLGLTKAAHIEWAAQNMLTNSSNFVDNADALEAACSNLIGVNLADLSTGAPSGMMITAVDCSEVADITAAVEFRTPPTQCNFEPLLDPNAPALCEGFGSVQTAGFEDFEGGSLPAGWTASSHDVVSPGTFSSPGWSVAGSLPAGNGSSYAAFAPDLNAGDCIGDIEAGAVALDSPTFSLPAGAPPHVSFDHWVATEAGWDGGNVKISVNGGAWTPVPGAAYSFNPYNDVIIGGGNDNPLADEEAFTGADEGSVDGSWGQSQVDLYGLAFPGDDVRLRFDLGTDGCNGLIGWYVDDVHVYTCSDEPLPICSDGALDFGEDCDDGNMDDGDGCSSTCQVEDGWICTDPMPSNPDGSNVVADESFEGGFPNDDWTPFNNAGIPQFPLCDPGFCGPALANTGSWYVWIGGFSTGVTASVEQTVVIPAAATDLTLQVFRGFCSPGLSDVLHVSLDGTDVGTVLCDATDGGYVEYTFPVAGFNDGGAHTLFIGGTTTGDGDTWTNFFVDDVVLNDNTPTETTPSVCTRIVEDLSCNAGEVEYDDGIADSWTVVDNEGTGVFWTDIASSLIGGNYTGGDGDAASANSDANIFTEFDTELISNSFSLESATSASLGYLANYQNLAGLDFLDLDISTDGGSSWTTLLSWNEDHPVGGLLTPPGEAVSVDLAAYLGESDVQVRWHYYDPNFGDWDWYAQVDNVALDCDLTGRMTGGGSVFDDEGTRYTHGFELHCADGAEPNNLEINWGRGNRFHLTDLTSALCSDRPFIDEGNPQAGFDTFIGAGTGRLNGVDGASITFRFTDAGEPGGNDEAEFTITGPDGASVSGVLDRGNHQADPE